MSSYIPTELRQHIRLRDRQRCCYCLTRESISGISLAFDHIHPQSKGGQCDRHLVGCVSRIANSQ
ncbi:MAG: HNH endonuclease [Spirulinaceae cyanobacterium]